MALLGVGDALVLGGGVSNGYSDPYCEVLRAKLKKRSLASLAGFDNTRDVRLYYVSYSICIYYLLYCIYYWELLVGSNLK